ncbi:MAG: DUF58 domain-containing protein [Oscillospiraceae bacterium]|nr:DUF58 domain-containing protein [Oscillospiraceae bacterium]
MLTFFVIVVLVALGLQWLSLRRAADHQNIRYSCRPSVRACEPGEEFLVLSDVANHGLRPSPAIRIEEHFPRELDVREAERFNVKWLTKEHRVYYSTVLLRGHQQVKRSLRASIARRGEYCFSYADFFAGDVLGFHEYAYRMENDSRIVIYPARLERAALPETFSDALDDLARKKRLLEDPISVCGYRGYTGTEPMRQISWKQSAAHSELIVKQYDPVWQRAVLIALDTDIHGDFDAYLEQLELCFSLARTVCEDLEQRDIGYQLVTNAPLREELSGFSSSGGMGGSFRKILYALGSAKGGSIAPVEELIHAVCSGDQRCETIVFLSTHCDRRVERALDRAQELRGGRIVPLFVDRLGLDGSGPSKGEEARA